MKKASLIIFALLISIYSFGQLTHPSGYFTMYPFSSSYDDGSSARLFYDGNNKEIIFWNSDTNTQFTSIRAGKIEGNIQHISGYMYIKPYSSSYDDGSETRLYYDGNNKQLVFVNTDANTANTGIKVGNINSHNIESSGLIKGQFQHLEGYLQLYPYDATYDDGTTTKLYYDGHNKRVVFVNSDGNTAHSGIKVGHIFSDGVVGIGTTSTGSHKLAVEGSIGAREVKVEASGWSDFVFEDKYKLRTLEEVENYIAENKHLPEIPSEAEVNENGINLGEMDAKLLMKIEELTLYMIEMNKQVKFQNERIELLEKENAELKKKLME